MRYWLFQVVLQFPEVWPKRLEAEMDLATERRS